MMAEAATWDVYVMEYARSKNQPWVDLISGMYHEGVMDLASSDAGRDRRPRGRDQRDLSYPCAFRPHGLDRGIPQRADLHSEERASLMVRSLRAAEAFQS